MGADAAGAPEDGRGRPRDAVAWLLPPFGAIVAALAFWLPHSPLQQQFFARDGDVGRHIRVGTWILEHGAIPTTDQFSHTMRGRPFVPYEWLAEVLYAAAHRLLGLAGAALLTSILFALSCAVVYRLARSLSASSLMAVAAAVFSLRLQAVHALPRPHMFTLALAALTLAALVTHRRTGRAVWAWLVPPLVLLWANLHGGFLVGFITLAAFAADAAVADRRERSPGSRARLKTLALVGACALVASFLNPAGPALWGHCISYLRTGYLVDITQEYMSPDFHAPEHQFFLGGLLVILLLSIAGKVRFAPVEVVLLLFGVASSLHSARNIPVLGVLVAPFMARWAAETLAAFAAGVRPGIAGLVRAWDQRLSATDMRFGRPAAPALLFLALMAWVVVNRHDARYAFRSDTFPVSALERARRDGMKGNVFNQFEWGGYLLYAAYPDIPVFIDGQTDFYGEALTREYVEVIELRPGWKSVLEKYRIDWTLVPSEAPLNQALELSPGWRRVYSDSTATIFARR